MINQENTEIRKIIHIDMDAFYASIEQRDFPEYLGKPLVVGGISRRGVVAAASYEARKYGIHSAMPTQNALKHFPGLILARPRFDVYKKVSREIKQKIREQTGLTASAGVSVNKFLAKVASDMDKPGWHICDKA